MALIVLFIRRVFCFYAVQATVYRCLPNGKLQTVHVFQDSDPSEDYYTCAWSLDTATGAPLLLVAGKNRLLQVINCVTGFLETVR